MLRLISTTINCFVVLPCSNNVMPYWQQNSSVFHLINTSSWWWGKKVWSGATPSAPNTVFITGDDRGRSSSKQVTHDLRGNEHSKACCCCLLTTAAAVVVVVYLSKGNKSVIYFLLSSAFFISRRSIYFLHLSFYVTFIVWRVMRFNSPCCTLDGRPDGRQYARVCVFSPFYDVSPTTRYKWHLSTSFKSDFVYIISKCWL